LAETLTQTKDPSVVEQKSPGAEEPERVFPDVSRLLNERHATEGRENEYVLSLLRTGKSRASRLVLGFYRSGEHGREALREARTKRLRRSAVIYRAPDGELSVFHGGLGPRERAALSGATSLAVAVVTAIGGVSPVAAAALAVSGFLIVWFGTLGLGIGIGNKVLRAYRGGVLPGESLVVVEATEEQAPEVIALLQHISDPSIFAIRPGPGFTDSTETTGQRREPTTAAALPDYAMQLADSHELEPSIRSRPLLPILRECEVVIERTRSDLAEAARLEYGITHAAEWLLDNAYLIRSNIADIRHNLPDNHNKILPVLTDRSAPVRLRVYHVAAELIDRSGHRLAADTILSFLNAYQDRCPLTIAELWVFPLMLRLVLIERLRRLSEVASLRQHQKELADFWADRVLNAAHRTPAQLEEMVAELERRDLELTPHFIERLAEQLHQEESALAPIQKWIQEKTKHQLPDIIRAEHAEEANDLMLISSAIGSLRQLSELQYLKIVESVSRMEAILRQDPAGIHTRSDFATRDMCRRVVEAAARQSKVSELDVARLAVDLAQPAPSGSREHCVAYYLLDEGLPELEKRLRRSVPWRERCLRILRRHPTAVYLGSLAALIAGISGAFLWEARAAGVTSPAALLFLGILALFPASELGTYLLQMFLTWFLPPRVLPKMSFEEGIPDDCRTLVVVPMMLLTPDAVECA